ncbi:hypothetical protein [Leuconostoc gelidum]|uniref:hypothetical protein n=1 Tax=Leuconostoc gelidum TaxID=1244 RepID=UPI001CC745E1|nr:hypothetical protein [Leuconostoc gelidum]
MFTRDKSLLINVLKFSTAASVATILSIAVMQLTSISANIDTAIVKQALDPVQSRQDEIQSLDRYVIIVNNQFVLL